jgi:L-fucose mutarotase
VLKGVHELVGADLIYALAAMGHGDDLAIVDRNFPAASMAQRLVSLGGADVISATEAVLSLFPLDSFVRQPVVRMEVVGASDEVPEVQQEFLRVCEKAEDRQISMGSLSREDFYARARQAFAIVATTEKRPYGCFLLVKGVINA